MCSGVFISSWLSRYYTAGGREERRCEFWALFRSCDFMCLICSRIECNEDVWVIEYHETNGIWRRKTARWIQMISVLMLRSCVVYSLAKYWKTKRTATIKYHLHLCIWQMIFSKAFFISSCIHWDSNPRPQRCKRHARKEQMCRVNCLTLLSCWGQGWLMNAFWKASSKNEIEKWKWKKL